MKVVDDLRRWLVNGRRGAVMLDLLEEVAAERPGGATLEAMEEIHQEALKRGIAARHLTSHTRHGNNQAGDGPRQTDPPSLTVTRRPGRSCRGGPVTVVAYPDRQA